MNLQIWHFKSLWLETKVCEQCIKGLWVYTELASEFAFLLFSLYFHSWVTSLITWEKNIICTNKTSLISKNNLWQIWCIWACSSTEETVRTVWKKLISFIQELDVEIDWNWLRRSEEEDFNMVSMYFRNIVITPPPLPRKKGFGPSVEQDFVTFIQAFVWNWFSGY